VEKHALSTLAVQQLTVSAGGASNPTFDDFFFQSGLMLQMGTSAHGCKKRIEKKVNRKMNTNQGAPIKIESWTHSRCYLHLKNTPVNIMRKQVMPRR